MASIKCCEEIAKILVESSLDQLEFKDADSEVIKEKMLNGARNLQSDCKCPELENEVMNNWPI